MPDAPTVASVTPRLTRIGCYGLAVAAHRLLLTQLRPNDESHLGGLWTLPGGGMDWGESPEDTLRREVYEETGLAPDNLRIFDVRSRIEPSTDQRGELHHVHVLYRIDVCGEPRVVEFGGSTVDARWLARDDLTELPVVPVFADLVEEALA